MTIQKGLALAGILASGLVTTAAVAEPAITTNWKSTAMTQSECLQRAKSALRRGGFRHTGQVGQSQFGVRDGYGATIRCVADKLIIFFVVTGPSRERTSSYMDPIYDDF